MKHYSIKGSTWIYDNTSTIRTLYVPDREPHKQRPSPTHDGRMGRANTSVSCPMTPWHCRMPSLISVLMVVLLRMKSSCAQISTLQFAASRMSSHLVPGRSLVTTTRFDPFSLCTYKAPSIRQYSTMLAHACQGRQSDGELMATKGHASRYYTEDNTKSAVLQPPYNNYIGSKRI